VDLDQLPVDPISRNHVRDSVVISNEST
jgi:hypothetical protein